MARRRPQRYGARTPKADLDPRLLGIGVTFFVLATYAALQLFLTRSSVNFLWWRAEQVRVQEHFHFPKAPNPAPAGSPTWQEWVPTAVTAVAITAALLALAIVLVRSGRGMWLLLVAALPLIPIELAPGVWAPSPVNSAAYALIFPPGALQPDTVWAWMEASLQSFAVILPALVIGRLLPVPRARMWAGDVLPRFSVPAAAGIVYLGWKLALGAPVDWGTDSRAALLVTVGGLVVTGIRNRPVGLLALAVTTALAGSLVTWTTDVTGHAAVVTDLAVWRTATLALLGAAWVLGQPYLAAAARGTYGIWRSALHAQAAGEDQGAQVPATDPDEVRPDAEVRLSLRPSPGAAAPAGGRHRA